MHRELKLATSPAENVVRIDSTPGQDEQFFFARLGVLDM